MIYAPCSYFGLARIHHHMLLQQRLFRVCYWLTVTNRVSERRENHGCALYSRSLVVALCSLVCCGVFSNMTETTLPPDSGTEIFQISHAQGVNQPTEEFFLQKVSNIPMMNSAITSVSSLYETSKSSSRIFNVLFIFLLVGIF